MREFRSFSPVYGSLARAIGQPAAPSAFSGSLTGMKFTGNKIHDIKTLRDLTGLGLRQAKETVEKIYEVLESTKYAELDLGIRNFFASWGPLANSDQKFTVAEIYQRINKYLEGQK